MGSCLSVEGASVGAGGLLPYGSASPSSPGGRSRDRRKIRRTISSNSSSSASPSSPYSTIDSHIEKRLHRVRGRICLNGCSDVTSLFTKQGQKRVNQDAMIVWEYLCFLYLLRFSSIGSFTHSFLIKKSEKKMVSANKEMVVYCFDTLVSYYNNEEVPPPAFDDGQHALRDRRFPPIHAKELPSLECTVSVLTDYETGDNHLDWENYHGRTLQGALTCFAEPKSMLIDPLQKYPSQRKSNKRS
ncbi:hypothetical protein CsatB_014576 [Cannabis sativa]